MSDVKQRESRINFRRRIVRFAPVALLVCLYVWLRLRRLDYYDLWFDEIFSVEAARQSWTTILGFVAADMVHPPLFYLLLKVWRAVGGESVWWLRLFPALTSIISLAPFFMLCRALRLRLAETWTTLFLFAVNAYLIYYAQEVRMYSLALLFVLASLWLFVRYVGDDKAQTRRMDSEASESIKDEAIGQARRCVSYDLFKLLAPLLIVNLLLVYTQYFGWLVVGVELLYLLVWRRARFVPFALSFVALLICFAPWAYAVWLALLAKRGLATNLAWLQRPAISDLTWFYGQLNGALPLPRTTLPGLLLFTAPVLFAAWRYSSRKHASTQSDPLNAARVQTFWMLALFAFLPSLVAFAASYVLPQPVWGARYLIVVAAPYLFLTVVAAYTLRPSWLRISVASLIVLWASVAGASALRSENQKLRWSTFVQAIRQQHAPDDANDAREVYTFEEWVAKPLRFSLARNDEQRYNVVLIKNAGDARGAHFYIAYRYPHGAHDDETVKATLRARGCRFGDETIVNDEGQTATLLPVACAP